MTDPGREPRTEAGRRLLTELSESPLPGASYAHEVVSRRILAIEAEAAAPAGLRTAAVAVCQLWFTDNAAEGSQHVRKAMLDLRAALEGSDD